MKRLLKFLQLTFSEKLLLIKAFILLGSIRVGLKFLPFQRLRFLLAKVFPSNPKLYDAEQASVEIDRVLWTVRTASHYVRKIRCLARALATQLLLEERGYSPDLCIGFTRHPKGKMSAHAWVEYEGKVIIGGAGNMARYIRVPLSAIDGEQKKGWFLLC